MPRMTMQGHLARANTIGTHMSRLSSSGTFSRQKSQRVSPWALTRSYWISEEWLGAWALLVVIVAIDLCIVWINVQITDWTAGFYDMLQTKNAGKFLPLLLVFCKLAFTYVALATVEPYLRQLLGFRWRQWMTTRFLHDWLGSGAFYRIERDRLADNPDQRISDDLQSFTTGTLSLTLDLLSTIVTLVSFISMLWQLPGALSFAFGAHHFTIAGYMVWAAALYALFGSIATHITGHPLVSINYAQQRVEANFRFGLIRLRENAEQIAFYNGMKTEITNAQQLFAHIRQNWWRVMNYKLRVGTVTNFYGQVAVVVPFILAVPHYFAGAFSFGVLMKIARTFGTVSDSFSWVIGSYQTLADWRATVNRLCEFSRITSEHGLNEAALVAGKFGAGELGPDKSRFGWNELGRSKLGERGLGESESGESGPDGNGFGKREFDGSAPAESAFAGREFGENAPGKRGFDEGGSGTSAPGEDEFSAGRFDEYGGPGRIVLRQVSAPRLATRGLALALPDGRPLARVRDVVIQPGARWLVRGPSGAGKSTLMRALAGLWPFGTGEIDTPADARTMFVPQQGYLPIGTLKAALAYPSSPDAFDDAACQAALRDCDLDEYAQRLPESGHWTRILSPGEQQRLAGARVLLHRPDYLFLDEATSALDPENEARLYRLFIERLPQTAIVSIAHRESLADFHDEILEIRRG